MADTVSSTYKLHIGFENSEGKIKYPVIIPNPKSSLTETQIQTAAQRFLDDKIILDDSLTNATDTYVSVATAFSERKTITDLDI